jgi:IS605 OrfB family transposase
MSTTETVIVKLIEPTKNKQQWLEQISAAFSDAVQLGLDVAWQNKTAGRANIHNLAYRAMRERFGLASDYARMAVNAAQALAASFYGLRKSKRQKRTSFPKVNGNQGIGLGTNAYKIIQSDQRFVLRCSTGQRGHYVWFPLAVAAKFREKMAFVKGDARIFKRDDHWYVMLPLKVPKPTVRDGERVFIGVDLGVVRLASVSTPEGVHYFNGKAARHQREHFAKVRQRYQRHNRMDKVKAMAGKERRWMTHLNHLISKRIVEIAAGYDNPIICFERLDGIRYRVHGSKRFNRMMSSWAFRQLIQFVQYKAERLGIGVIFVDPRSTSRTCRKCGHSSRSNRPTQSQFRCVKCNHQDNADGNASGNIADRGALLSDQGAL